MFFNFDLGDYLIHQKYGVGRFIGIQGLKINGTLLDFFKVEYQNDSFLLIPSYNIGVFKFHSQKTAETKIEVLGRSKLIKKQAKVKEEIAKTAQELMEIYKQREAIKVPFFIPQDQYIEFCKGFTYELTASQSKSLSEIVLDLSKTKPMDRLLCGDVGFGKTEVAARAIALVLSNKYKAIFIVPTTILAVQHLKTLKERFEKIEKKCAMLSKLDENTTLTKKAWEKGEIDLLITTAHHKGIDSLLREDVGLIILDEEHHFGVKFKEKIRLKAHCLQLSATPIPRTLHLALSKIKDISLLEYPPVGRKEIIVRLCSLNELKLEEILKKEIEKGGKIFCVVPRVQLIEEIAKLITFAPYVTLHGQQTKEEMANSLNEFVSNDKKIIICTNIIESGMNIAEANLMIVFYAHMFGVAQLHQLKGRVGRASKQGQVYFIQPNTIKELSAERIKMIQENSSLGGGFALSMKDMELRGSGTVVGHKQSGQDYGFGAEMYYEMLSENLGEKKRKKQEQQIAWIGFENATIEADYIADEKTRCAFYKKLSLVNSLKELMEINEDLNSFGESPTSLKNFLDIVKINLLSSYFTLKKVIKKQGIIEIFYEDQKLKNYSKFQNICKIEPMQNKLQLNISNLGELIERFESEVGEH